MEKTNQEKVDIFLYWYKIWWPITYEHKKGTIGKIITTPSGLHIKLHLKEFGSQDEINLDKEYHPNILEGMTLTWEAAL